MRISVRTIKTLLWVTVISAPLTVSLSYCSINCENWWFQWSNAISLGVFSSSLVVLLSEYVKYKHLMSEIEADLYYNLSLVYLKLKTIVVEIDKTYHDPSPQMTSSFLKPQATDTNNGNERIRYDILQYCTLRENMISKKTKNFILSTVPVLTSIVLSLRELEVALNEDILDVYKDNLEAINQFKSEQTDNYIKRHPHITSSSPHTNKVLQKVVSLINDELFDSIESLLLAISKRKSNNFDWEKDKERILKLV